MARKSWYQGIRYQDSIRSHAFGARGGHCATASEQRRRVVKAEYNAPRAVRRRRGIRDRIEAPEGRRRTDRISGPGGVAEAG
jgi:hypothetical protein